MDVFAIRCAAMRVGVWAGALLVTACTPAAPASQATQSPNTTQTTAASVMAQEYRNCPLQIPVLAQGQRCPSSTPRPVTERFGPAIGDGPVYAAGRLAGMGARGRSVCGAIRADLRGDPEPTL